MNTHHTTTKTSSSGIFVCTAPLVTTPPALCLSSEMTNCLSCKRDDSFLLHDRPHADGISAAVSEDLR
jgi:hypothetical protein